MTLFLGNQLFVKIDLFLNTMITARLKRNMPNTHVKNVEGITKYNKTTYLNQQYCIADYE